MTAPAVAVTPIMNALVAAAARSGTPHHAFSTGTLMIPPPIPRSDDTLPARTDAASASGRGQGVDAIGDDRAALLLEESPAEHAGIDRRIEDHVPPLQPRDHDDRDDHRRHAEEPLQRRLRDQLRGDAAEQAAAGCRDLEQ